MVDETLAAELRSYAHGRVPQALRRRQLLVEARELFVEKGYAQASMDELARRMSLSKPVVYQLAGSKEQLFRDVIATVHQELTASIAAAVAREADLEGKLHAGILSFLRFVRRHQRGWVTLLSMEAGPPGADMAALRQGQVQVVAGLLAEDLRREDPAVDRSSVEVLAIAINGAIESAAWWWQSHPKLTPEALAQSLTALLAPGLLAVAARPKRARPRRRG
jgi:AcrR family transcriptional regulator